MSTRRVVITGMGWVTPLGCDIQDVWQRLLAGERAFAPVTRFDAASFRTSFAAEVKDFHLADHVEDAADHERASISTQYAVAAAQRAWEQAGLADCSNLERRRMGVYLGAGEGPVDTPNFFGANIAGWDAQNRKLDDSEWIREALATMDPQCELEQEPNFTVSHIANRFGAHGPASNCMTACAAGTQAIGEAFEIIRHDDADVMLAGGAHSMIHPLGMTGFIRLTAMSTRNDDPLTASRPFSASREGFVMGEGAGILILEELEHAKKRGANILAELVGYGSSADAYRITDIEPEGRGGAGAMLRAMKQAGINPKEPDAQGRPPVHYISAHGTGTPENDGIETKAVKLAFGDLAPNVPFSSVKSMLGHLIQAAGAVELMTCVKAIETGIVPPTANLNDPDPACDLDYVPNQPRDYSDKGGIDVCLSNGFGFGGQNDCVCVRKYAN